MGYRSKFTGKEIDKRLDMHMQVTHEELCDLILNGKLIPGHKYLLTDYRLTIGDIIWGYTVSRSRSTRILILLTAITSTRLAIRASAFADNYGELLVDYIPITLTNGEIVGAKGAIIKMISPRKNIECHFDFINMFVSSNGYYSVFSYWGGAQNVHIGVGTVDVIITSSDVQDVYIGSRCSNIRINKQSLRGLKIGDRCKDIFLEKNVGTDYFQDDETSKNIFIGNDCTSITLNSDYNGSYHSDIRIGNNCSNINLYKTFTDVIVDDNNTSLYIYGGDSTAAIGEYSKYHFLSSKDYSITDLGGGRYHSPVKNSDNWKYYSSHYDAESDSYKIQTFFINDIYSAIQSANTTTETTE